MKECQQIKDQSNQNNEIILELKHEDSLYEWKGSLKGFTTMSLFNCCSLCFSLGPPNSPYENAEFKFQILLNNDYPMSPPTVSFAPRSVFHPNVSWTDGIICLDLLTKEAWSPSWTLLTTMQAIRMLLDNPEPDSPLNVDAANILRAGDIKGYRSYIQMLVEKDKRNGVKN